ncbi:MAG: hypothetical protein LBP75_08595 [Planctomycetota bacterium]|jgi:hypothetical protein|nr:hypothetical protein [Planctomycetota bacterium]
MDTVTIHLEWTGFLVFGLVVCVLSLVPIIATYFYGNDPRYKDPPEKPSPAGSGDSATLPHA